MSAGHVIETPVVDHLTFQVWDSTTGTPAQRYAWTGGQDASTSTLTAGRSVLRTNLARDPKVTRPAAHTATGFRPLTGSSSYTTYQGSSIVRWERTATGAATVAILRNEPAVAPAGRSVSVKFAVFSEYGDHTFRLVAAGSTTPIVTRTVRGMRGWEWVPIELVGTIPAGSAASLSIEVTTAVGNIADTAAGMSGSSLYVSGVTVESGTAGDPFDGDTQDVPATAGSWQDLANKATGITIRRGGQQKGAGLETQVGTLDAELVGALNLSRVSELRPNSPLRVIRPPAEPALVWDLQPADAADAYGSQAWSVRSIAISDSSGTSTQAGASYPSAGYLGATFSASSTYGTQTIAAGSILIASPNESPAVPVPTNPKPVGVFDAGESYTLTAAVQSTQDDAVHRVKWVVFTGDPLSPSILAESKPFTPSRVLYGAEPRSWTFVAPGDDGWKIGLATADELVTTPPAGSFSWTYAVAIRGAQVWDHGRERPEFTGTISDLYQSVELDKSTNEKHVFTTVQAVDAVQSLANTDRYGVVARSGAGYQSWADRIDQLSESARVPIDAPAERDVIVYDQRTGNNGEGAAYSSNWASSGALDNATGYYVGFYGPGEYRVYPLPNWEYAGPYATTLRGVSVSRTLDGLDTAAGYVLVATVTVPTNVGVTPGDWRFAFDNGNALQWGPAVDLTAGGAQTVAFQFQPSATSGKVGLYQAGTSAVAKGGSFTVKLSDVRVLQVRSADPYVLQDVAYESTLLNHFDLACNSVGARWYVTKRGAVLFRRAEEDAEPGARFSDTAAGDVSYTDVQLSYDTRNVVNSLKLNQHGYDPATGNAVDVATTYTDDDSIDKWGARAAELDTCLYLGSPHQSDGERRARELMAGLRQPTYSIQSFTINAQSDPSVLDAVELRSTVAIDYEDIRQRARVLAIEHAITPTRWMVTVTVNEPRVGPRFRDVNAVLAGKTFAEVNALLAGKTFAEVSALPFDPPNPEDQQ